MRPAGIRGHRAPVIHMVIGRGPARTEPRISSPGPLSGFYCQLREERREERREGRAGSLFACLPAFVLFRVFFFFADHSSDWPRNVTALCRAKWIPDSAMEASQFSLKGARDKCWAWNGLCPSV